MCHSSSSQQASPQYETEPEAEPLQDDSFSSQRQIELSQENADKLF
ncbi:2506_t:CDS:1, partial [Racocetra fulgida]